MVDALPDDPSARAAHAEPPPAAASAPRAPQRGRLLGLALLFLLLAGLQVASVLMRSGGERERDVFARVTDPTTARWLLGATDPANPRPVAVVFFDERDHRLLVKGGALPALAASQTYVLWALSRNGVPPRNLAAFRGGDGVLDAVVPDAPPAASLAALAISIERDPRAASPAPMVASGGP